MTLLHLGRCSVVFLLLTIITFITSRGLVWMFEFPVYFTDCAASSGMVMEAFHDAAGRDTHNRRSTSVLGGETDAATEEEVFFDDTDPFFNPSTTNPIFEETLEQFFDVKEEDNFFKKENDIFDKIKADEAFFFNTEEKRVTSKKLKVNNDNSKTITQGSRFCNCKGLYCGCCTSVKFLGKERFRGCFEMEYVPNDFAIFMTLSINGHTIITRVISGRNPLPFCAKSTYIPLVAFCIRIYDIHHNPQGISMCMRLEVTSMRQILFSISFDCIKIDNHKISFLMPPNATTFGVVGLHLGDTDPYLSYQDWTKLHFPLPDVSSTSPAATVSPVKHHFLWF